MDGVYVVDNDFLDKLAGIDEIEFLRLEGNRIIITDKVYAELSRGAELKIPSATRAMDWLDANRNEPWLELEAPTKIEPGKGMGERSIVALINERKLVDPDVSYTILTDNKKDLNKIQLLLDDKGTEIRLVREFAVDLSEKGMLSADELRKFDAPSFSAPRQGGFISSDLLVGDLSAKQAMRMGGVAASGYDAYQTALQASELWRLDNATAANEEWMRFGARNIAGWGGGTLTAAAIGTTGAGPLALVAADTVLMVEAADKAVTLWQNEKIYTQKDRDEPGVTWQYDGKAWIREDLRADRVGDGTSDPQPARYSAQPEKARQLSYQAGVEAAEQALGHVPTPRNPFVQPVSESDSAHLHATRWSYSMESGRWSRMVADTVDREGAPEWSNAPEYASAERAAQLNAQAVRTIDENLRVGPAVVAMRYQFGHQAYGYGEVGEVPAAVTSAMTIDRLRASDDRYYERDAQGAWTRNGEPAPAPRALELDLTRERLQLAMQAYESEFSRIPEWRPPTPEEADRAELRRQYINHHRDPDVRPEEFEAAYAAVQRTRSEHGITPENSALELGSVMAGQSIADIEIRHTRREGVDGKNVVSVAITTPDDIAAELRSRQLQGQEGRSSTPGAPEQLHRDVLEARDMQPPEDGKPEPSSAMLLDDPAHQNHAMYAAALRAVNERDVQMGRQPDEISRQLAAGLVEKARERGLETIMAAKFTPDGTKVCMSDSASLSAERARTAVGEVRELAGQKLSQSSENVASINQQQVLQQGTRPPARMQSVDGQDGAAPKGPHLI